MWVLAGESLRDPGAIELRSEMLQIFFCEEQIRRGGGFASFERIGDQEARFQLWWFHDGLCDLRPRHLFSRHFPHL